MSPMQRCSSTEGSSEHPEKRGGEGWVGKQWDTGNVLSEEEQFKGMTGSRMRAQEGKVSQRSERLDCK